MRETLHHLRLRIRALWRRRQLDRDLEDEFAYHLELRRANGEAPAPFGNRTSLQERCREMWTWNRVENAWRELRQAVRVLRRSPGHSAAIVVLLALGIGANAAMFSLVNALFLRELPVHEPGRLVAISPGWATQPFDDFRKAQQSFSGILGTGSLFGVVVATESGEQLAGTHGGIVSGNYFQVLGVRPEIGRLFTEDDDRIGGAQPVMVIGAPFWRRQFGESPSVIGRKIFLSGSPFTIIGVTHQQFAGEMPGRVRDFWVPLNMQTVASPQGDLRKNPGFPWLSSMGRLKPGVSLAAAKAESQAVRDRLFTRPGKLQLEPAGTGFGGIRRSFGTQLQILAGIVGMVLLIVWTNVATLLLARGAARQREMAVRQALGCGRWRLMRQLLLEGVLLAAAGGAIGLALAPSFAQALVLMRPSFDVVQLDLTVDARLLAFGTAVSLLTAIAFSLAPALRASRIALQSRAGAGSRQRTIRSLVALQAAFSVVLVAVSLLFARSLLQLRAADYGYDRGHIIHTTLNLPLAGYRDGASQALLGKRLVERLSRLPRRDIGERKFMRRVVGLLANGNGERTLDLDESRLAGVLRNYGHVDREGPRLWTPGLRRLHAGCRRYRSRWARSLSR